MARFKNRHMRRMELTTSDVFLDQQHWDGGSRLEVSTTPLSVMAGLTVPMVAANMNSGCGTRLAEVLARCGGIGLLPQDIREDKLALMLAKIKRGALWCDTALTVAPDTDIGTVESIIFKRASRVVVVVENGKPIGVVKPEDIIGKDKFTPVSRVMSADVITILHGTNNADAFNFLHRKRVDSAPVVDENGQLIGVISRDDLVLKSMASPALGPDGKLMVGLAIGINGGAVDKAHAALTMGVNVLCIDTAHGNQRKMVETIRAVRDAVGSEIPIVAGNVCNADGVQRLVEAGANIVKVGVGPGGQCTTRLMTGVGRPQFSAVVECVEAAQKIGAEIMPDGGVRYPRDMIYYLAAGGATVMFGTLLTGTYESPGDMKFEPEKDNPYARPYKIAWGMASGQAVVERNDGIDPYQAAIRATFQEGVSGSRVYLKPGMESVTRLVIKFMTGLRSAMSYSGSHGLKEFAEKAVFGLQTAGGFSEGTPHGSVSS